MAKTLQKARELLSREDLIGFDVRNWAEPRQSGKGASAIRSSLSKVGGKVGAKVGTKAGIKVGPGRR